MYGLETLPTKLSVRDQHPCILAPVSCTPVGTVYKIALTPVAKLIWLSKSDLSDKRVWMASEKLNELLPVTPVNWFA